MSSPLVRDTGASAEQKARKAAEDKAMAVLLCAAARIASWKAHADGTRLQRARIVHGIAKERKAAAERELERSRKMHQELVDPQASAASSRPATIESLHAAKTKVERDEVALRNAIEMVNRTADSVTNAESIASKSKMNAIAAAERALQAQKTANASAREAGLAEPFPERIRAK
ncbi:hypothetical protein JQX13_07115 [Archangium violaceum]|uniref:hypothetical protein n=1 Tax=Archangium violaceum TaxID=83451 RepID=UPI00193B5DF9|nr:hypothetical protein [Archangium violaceum]QRK09872.1 hypothetical protein JQX13_07115 [Archangium violaceum]